jgi:hypothetical protein
MLLSFLILLCSQQISKVEQSIDENFSPAGFQSLKSSNSADSELDMLDGIDRAHGAQARTPSSRNQQRRGGRHYDSSPSQSPNARQLEYGSPQGSPTARRYHDPEGTPDHGHRSLRRRPSLSRTTSRSSPTLLDRNLRSKHGSVSDLDINQLIIAPLNYHKIGSDLLTTVGLQRCLLLQALRWRLTTPAHQDQRYHTLQQFIQADFLGCRSARRRTSTNAARFHPHTSDLISQLLTSKEYIVRESIARLLNALATSAQGRGYLLSHPLVMEILLDMAVREETDTLARQHALGALQKFSLRRVPQSHMIRIGVVEWLLVLLQGFENLSEYSLEYGTALLMNLSLRTAGKIKCGPDVTDVLGRLLNHPNSQVRTYINGTIYALLSRRAMRIRARSMGMEQVLMDMQGTSEPPFQEQIKCILQQLDLHDAAQDDARAGYPEEAPDSGEEDNGERDEAEVEEGEEEEEEDEADEEEDELDRQWRDVEVQDGRTPQRGEQLLCVNYLAEASNAQSQIRESQRALSSRRERIRSSHGLRHSSHGYRPDQHGPLPSRAITPLTKSKRRQGNSGILSSHNPEVFPAKEFAQPPTPFQKHNRVPRSPLGYPYDADQFGTNSMLAVRRSRSDSQSPHSESGNFSNAMPRNPGQRRGSLVNKGKGKGPLNRGSGTFDPDTSGRIVAMRGNKVFTNEDQFLGSHIRTLASPDGRIPPPRSLPPGDDNGAPEEGLSQYYKAFTSRSKMTRTPYTGPAYAGRDEFPRIPMKTRTK